MVMAKKYRGKGKRVVSSKIFGMPTVVYCIEYDEGIVVHNGETMKEIQYYHADGSVTIEGEVIEDGD